MGVGSLRCVVINVTDLARAYEFWSAVTGLDCRGRRAVITQPGAAISHAVFSDRDAFLAVNPQINEIVAVFGDYFVGPPVETLGDVLVTVQGPDLE